MNERARFLRQGRIVEHFKRDFLSEYDKLNTLKYLYEVVGIAKHTETGEDMVIYRSLYRDEKGNFGLYVRPIDIFLSEVDRKKYPQSRRKYRFEFH